MPFVVIIKIEKFDENDKQEQYIHFIIIRGNILQVARYFREPHRREKNTGNEQNICSYYMLNLRIRKLLFHSYHFCGLI